MISPVVRHPGNGAVESRLPWAGGGVKLAGFTVGWRLHTRKAFFGKQVLFLGKSYPTYNLLMVRLSDLHPVESEHLRKRAEAMPAIGPGKWITPPALDQATVAIVSTAGLHRRIDPPFAVGSLDYRIIPGDIQFDDLVLSHISANFDRSAFGEDPNIVFPIDRLRELATAGEIGGVARWHYSFMGAMPDPSQFEETGEEIGRLMAQDGVDVAFLVPI